VTPALRDVFTRSKISNADADQGTSGLKLSQMVAMYLLERGVGDDVYFEELAGFARDAIDANPPEAFLEDVNGREDPRKGFTRAFESWCATRNMVLADCWRKLPLLGVNLSYVSVGRDPHAIIILREALKMSNHALVGVAVSGLAKLDDAASVPLIAQACSRFNAVKAEGPANFLIHARRFCLIDLSEIRKFAFV
jgi:hypothetical protein